MKLQTVGSKIKLHANPCDAPGCIIIASDNGKDLLIQSDYEWPSIAQSFGWDIRSVQKPGISCDHSCTDGSIKCPVCGLAASEFIHAAFEWMEENDGIEAEDPGYFGQD